MRRLVTTNAILMVCCLLAPFLSVITYLATGNLIYALASLICTTFVSLALVRYALIEPSQGKFITVTKIFGVGLFGAASVVSTQSSIVWQLAPLLHPYLPGIIPDSTSHDFAAVFVAVVIIVATVVVAWLVARSQNLERGTLRQASALTQRELEIIARTLEDYLDGLDQELRFFDFRSPTIDPKLEELNTTSRRITIKSAFQVTSRAANRDFIVVKGEPGSGKSVMLRNLARQLLGKIGSGGKIPLLLNMRDWSVSLARNQIEIADSLHEWAKAEFRRQTGSRTPSIADDEFDQLYAEGSFIFLFDSFDENAAVSGSPHHGSFIGQLSRSLVEYVRASGGCVGLVFSREYKSPSAGWLSHRIYGVRPFSDKDIKRYIAQNCSFPEPLTKAIMGERRDLYAMSKTPLLLALLVDFSNSNSGDLPRSEFEVFENFILRRITRAITALGLSDDKIPEAQKAAKLLARKLSRRGSTTSPSEVGLAILREAKLLRRSDAGEVFSHKRFQEYFRVCSMLSGEEAPPSISPNEIDEHRDVLNLFAQICSVRRAKRLAKEAYNNLKSSYEAYDHTGEVANYEATILSLRFLRNAFRNRPRILNKYRTPVREIVVALWNRLDVLNQKHAVEHISLIPADTATSLVRISLRGSSGLLRRVALSEARYVSSLQPWLGRCVSAHFSKQDDLIYSVEHSKGGLTAPMTNAALADRVSMDLDAALRVTLIILPLTCLFFGSVLLSVESFAILFFLYAVLNSGQDGSSSNPFEFISDWGFNPGLSGLFAFNIALSAFFNVVGAFANPSNQFFWMKPGPVWLSSMILLASLTMLANNFLVRRRDALDELGEVKPLSRAVLTIERPTRVEAVAFLKRYWLLLSVVFAILVTRVTNDVRIWAATGMIWLLAVASGVVSQIFLNLRASIATRRDRPKVIKFERHFSGKRDEISDALSSVRTYQGRIDILIAADAKSSEFATRLREPTNDWPSGRRPTFEPNVDSYLAMLDERWWGLG